MTVHALPLPTVPPTTVPALTITVEVTVASDRLGAVEDFLARVEHLANVTVNRSGRHTGAAAAVHRLASERTVRVQPDLRLVTRGETEFELTRREFDLFHFLARHPGQVFSRDQLLRQVWGNARSGERTVDVHVTRVRRRLAVAGQLIVTVRGVGYRLDERADIVVGPG